MNDQTGQQNEFLQEWKVCVESSMHFNDILFKIRLIGLSLFFSVLGIGLSAIYTFSEESSLRTYPTWAKSFVGDDPLPTVVISLALIYLTCLFIFDYEYYYQALLGSVMRTVAIEEKTNLKQATIISNTVPPIIANASIFLLYSLTLSVGVFLLFAVSSASPVKIYLTIAIIIILSSVDGVRRTKRDVNNRKESVPEGFQLASHVGDWAYIFLLCASGLIFFTLGFFFSFEKPIGEIQMQIAWFISIIFGLSYILLSLLLFGIKLWLYAEQEV